MVLKFCERCQTLMIFREEEDMIIFECPSCNFIETAGDISSLKVKDKIIHLDLNCYSFHKKFYKYHYNIK